MEEIASGAEATLYRKRHEGADAILKERHPKRYRHPLLDAELRRSRTRREARILEKLPVPGPSLLETDRESRILMEFIDGSPLKRLLDAEPAWAERVGEELARLHDAAIIHGDLTTSNMLVSAGRLFLIDFGLSFTSHSLEDKAVDIHLFKRALESKHHLVAGSAYRAFLKGYRSSNEAERVLDRLAQVERRGRNKAKY